ncbi:MAG: hypothetical protein WCF03_13080 [Nitrososphaeraceae archaeon]
MSFSIESEEKTQLIDEAVSIKVGIGNVGLCRDIEYFFHCHNNEELTINDFLRFFKEFRIATQIVDLKLFSDTVSDILDILVENGYIKLQTHHDDPLKRVYKRQYNIY